MFVLELWDDECSETTFYTVRKNGAEMNETDRFLSKFQNDPKYKEALRLLIKLIIEQIGDKFGARDAFFNRPEEGPFGLPPKGKVRVESVSLQFLDFPLRLYAMRIREREDLVVLFNGGAKESRKNVNSPGLHHSWQEAKVFTRKIQVALEEGLILVEERSRTLVSSEVGDEIIIY